VLTEFAKQRLWGVYVAEIARCRKRVDELRDKYPSASAQELAQRLTDTKKTWASIWLFLFYQVNGSSERPPLKSLATPDTGSTKSLAVMALASLREHSSTRSRTPSR